MSVALHFDPIGHEAPSFTIYGADDFAASLLQLWIAAHAERSDKDTRAAASCSDAMKHWRYLQRKPPLEILDYVPEQLLLEAIARRRAARGETS